MSNRMLIILLVLGLSGLTPVAPATTATDDAGQHQQPQASAVKAEELPVLKPAGKKNELPDGRYFVWEFNQTPKMGTVILRVQVFDRDGNQLSNLKIEGRSDMPSMRGHHDSGDVAFKLNNQGVYLLPVNIVMPGDWEIILTFKEGDRIIFRGRILFRV